jgi:transcriptional regulator with XRE-family HTH domain
VKNLSKKQFLKRVGKRLREFRKSRSMSQEALASEAKVSISQIGRIEQGEADSNLRTLKKLSTALNISLKELFDF